MYEDLIKSLRNAKRHNLDENNNSIELQAADALEALCKAAVTTSGKLLDDKVPCRLSDVFYLPSRNEILPVVVKSMALDKYGIHIETVYTAQNWEEYFTFNLSDIGEKIFLTREEAVEAKAKNRTWY